jgi:hypothetical protein
MRWKTALVTVSLLLTTTAARAKPCKEGDDTTDDCKEYEAYMSPGAHAQVFAPAVAKGQPYFGGGPQISIAQWAHDNNDYGPSRGNVFFQASMLKSASSEHVMALYEGGLTLSLERNANRRFAIPYFGFTTGGLFRKALPSAAYIQPLAGMHVVWTPNVMIDVQGGYLFPFTAIDDLHGWRAQATLRLHMW